MSLQPMPLPPTALEPSGINDIMVALERIEPGQLVVYHRGRLAVDRIDDERLEPEERGHRREIALIATRAHEMATEDRPRIHLTQFRMDHGNFAYVATGAAGCDRRLYN
ncbi:MAG: hypothetical protein QOE22_676 [Candidatus Parcubacteria bacterium]|jgi:hypothetical protein|nr:hypothetical protein [Candidatus Parcubacteria bacterium]